MYELAHFLLYIKNSAVRGYNLAVLPYICLYIYSIREVVFTTEVSHTGMNLDLFLQTIKLSRTRNLVVPQYNSPHRQSIDRVRQIYFAVLLFVYLHRHRLL